MRIPSGPAPPSIPLRLVGTLAFVLAGFMGLAILRPPTLWLVAGAAVLVSLLVLELIRLR